MSKKIVLASSSPRRRDILTQFNIDFQIIESDVEEKIYDDDNCVQTAMSLAFEKATDVANRLKGNEIVIAADTLVVYKDNILGKPQSREEALKMLLDLNGDEHFVITGISLIQLSSNMKIIDYEKTKVNFRKMTKEKLLNYIDKDEYKDKAGGYAIQGYGGILVNHIEGSYLNIVGLPMSKIDDILEKHFDFEIL